LTFEFHFNQFEHKVFYINILTDFHLSFVSVNLIYFFSQFLCNYLGNVYQNADQGKKKVLITTKEVRSHTPFSTKLFQFHLCAYLLFYL